MKRWHVHNGVAFFSVLMLMSAVASAEEAPPQKHFIPLDKARAEQSGVHVVRAIPLRSDAEALRNGNLRSDATPKPARQIQAPLIVPVTKASEAAAGEVAVQRGGASENQAAALFAAPEEASPTTGGRDPVLGLYDDNEEPLMSFADAMAGKRVSVPLASLAGKYGWPLPATAKQKFTSAFGMRADPFNGKPEFHGGIDLAADAGTPVLATAAGTVVEASQDARYGKYISIAHPDGGISRYGHLLGLAVREGQQVARGDMIGAVGMTGRATGPHLDYRYRVNGRNVDPMQVLTPPDPSLRVAQR